MLERFVNTQRKGKDKLVLVQDCPSVKAAQDTYLFFNTERDAKGKRIYPLGIQQLFPEVTTQKLIVITEHYVDMGSFTEAEKKNLSAFIN